MYPEGKLINNKENKLVVFEKDQKNPHNEGFIYFWELKDITNKEFIFKQRLSRAKALIKWDNLIREGWEKIKPSQIAA